MTNKGKLFGQILRDRRIEKGYSLRKFAKLVGVSPTYLSQVEQMNVDPPTADRVKRMAEILEENVDEWMALAGRLSHDLPEIIHQKPREIPDILRAIQGLTAEQLRKLREEVEEMKRKEES